MTIEERRQRDRADRRALITAAARRLAETEGWRAVTTRRLSTEIEYSQPVIYKHFASLDDLAEAVALEGFSELATALAQARQSSPAGGSVRAFAHAYISFARENPALYEAMFIRATRLRFGEQQPGPLSAAFAELKAAISTLSAQRDLDLVSEVFWSALHGLASLERDGRLRTGLEQERVELLVRQFGSP